MKKLAISLCQDPIIPALALGSALRLLPIITSSFPLNDGGLFYTMTQELLKNGFRLPIYTSYNHTSIPYAYPPLAFYVAGVLTKLLPITLIDIFRFLPVLVSILTIPAFYLLAKELLSSGQAKIATFIFAIMPRSYMWFIMGGGLTRSFGLLFSLLTLYFVIRYLNSSNRKGCFILISIGLALTTLSHLEWGTFVFCSTFLIFLFKRGFFRSVLPLAKICLTSALMTLAWWGLVISRHGVDPFLFTSRAGFFNQDIMGYPSLLTFRITDEPFLAILGSLGLIGLLISLSKREFFLPLWFIIPIVTVPRSSLNLVVIPLSFLITTTISEKLFLDSNDETPAKKSGAPRKDNSEYLFKKSFYAFLALYMTLSAMVLVGGIYYKGILSEERAAMDWIKDNTSTSSKFILITDKPADVWGMDSISEWFPSLTERASITTPQGLEWLPDNEFYKRVKFYNDIRSCYDESLECLEEVVINNKDSFSHIYVYKPGVDSIDLVPAIRRDLRKSSNYSLIYDELGAAVFARKSAL